MLQESCTQIIWSGQRKEVQAKQETPGSNNRPEDESPFDEPVEPSSQDDYQQRAESPDEVDTPPIEESAQNPPESPQPIKRRSTRGD